MNHSPHLHSWDSQVCYSLHDHFANYSKDISKPNRRITRASTEPTFTFSRQDTLYDHFSRNTYSTNTNSTKRSSSVAFPYSSSTCSDVRNWIQRFLNERNVFVSNEIISKITWNGVALRTIDVTVQGVAVLDLIRWGIEVKEARMICAEIERQRSKVKKDMWGKVCNCLLQAAAFVTAVVIVSVTYLRYQTHYDV